MTPSPAAWRDAVLAMAKAGSALTHPHGHGEVPAWTLAPFCPAGFEACPRAESAAPPHAVPEGATVRMRGDTVAGRAAIRLAPQDRIAGGGTFGR